MPKPVITLLLIYPETVGCLYAKALLVMVQTKHAILILCHCTPTKHTPLSSPDNPVLPACWKQITFGYMAICHREDKIEHKLNVYLSRDILLRYVQPGYVYSRGKKLKFEKSSLLQVFPLVNSDLQRSQ